MVVKTCLPAALPTPIDVSARRETNAGGEFYAWCLALSRISVLPASFGNGAPSDDAAPHMRKGGAEVRPRRLTQEPPSGGLLPFG